MKQSKVVTNEREGLRTRSASGEIYIYITNFINYFI